jgi:hypothetical protein
MTRPTLKATEQQAQPKTEAWLIEWGIGAERGKHVFTHNAIADYRDLFKDATVTELVRRLPLPPTSTDLTIKAKTEPLTDDQILLLIKDVIDSDDQAFLDFARQIEAAHNIHTR